MNNCPKLGNGYELANFLVDTLIIVGEILLVGDLVETALRLFFYWLFGYGVIAMGAAPGVAFADAFQAHPKAFYNAPFFNGASYVVGAGRLKTTFGA
ncbi:MAG: hypothetical protein DHS20C18_24140 [Saprospiraceae bacterium]|nr:MAG: hypothetical protein DHS20C18_24140 [Saprospiraceae bacterium]